MKKLDSFLVRSKICDADGTLSLTSVMMMVLIVKVALSPALDLGTVATFFMAIASYNGKKWFARDRARKSLADTDKLTQLETEVKSLIQVQNLSQGLRR